MAIKGYKQAQKAYDEQLPPEYWDDYPEEGEDCETCGGTGTITVECSLCHGSGWVRGVPGGEICCGGTDTADCPDCR